MAQLDHLRTDFLASLPGAGVDPSAVDVVVNTHLHFDHVGWNTCARRRLGTDVSERPYLVPKRLRHFNPDGDAQRRRRGPGRGVAAAACPKWR